MALGGTTCDDSTHMRKRWDHQHGQREDAGIASFPYDYDSQTNRVTIVSGDREDENEPVQEYLESSCYGGSEGCCTTVEIVHMNVLGLVSSRVANHVHMFTLQLGMPCDTYRSFPQIPRPTDHGECSRWCCHGYPTPPFDP